MRTLSCQARKPESLRAFWRAVGRLAVAAAVLGNVAAAHAAPPLRDVGPVSADFASGGSQIVADRTRLAYMPVAGHVRVLDENLTEVAQVIETGCAWRSFGGGALLWNCAEAAGYPFGYSLVDELAGGERRVLAPPAVPSGAHGEAPEWAEIGLRWLTVFYGSPDSRAYVKSGHGQGRLPPRSVRRGATSRSGDHRHRSGRPDTVGLRTLRAASSSTATVAPPSPCHSRTARPMGPLAAVRVC